MRFKLTLVLLLVVCITLPNVIGTANTSAQTPPMLSMEDAKMQTWVDSTYNSLSLDQQIGQLFMIRAHSNKGADHEAYVERLVKRYHVGGMCFFQGTPEAQAKLINRYQAQSNIPLLMAIDGEWGLGMRMKQSTISFPRQMTLGAIQDNTLIYDMGKEIAYQMRRAGIHVNFAPVVDVNNNPQNPVINTRSFGEDRHNVAIKSWMYMRGMQDHDLMACAKHFPGHGDTNVDSHYDLPVIQHSLRRLDSLELYPFQIMAEQEIGSMMVAHLHVPVLDDRENRPTSLSYASIAGVLREQMGFEGLIFTDGLEMKGVTKHFQPGEVEAEAILAGNDVLLLPEDVSAALETIKEYIEDGKISTAQIEESVKRILEAKYKLGLSDFTPIEVKNIRSDLNNQKAQAIKQKLYENALTLVRNDNDLVPFREIEDLQVAALSIGSSEMPVFQERLHSYLDMPFYQTDKNITEAEERELLNKLSDKEVVIVSLHDLSSYANKDYGLTASQKAFIKKLQGLKQVVLVNFGSPYMLKYFDGSDSVLNAYEEDPMAQDAAAQALFGAIPIRGRLPVTASTYSVFGKGITTNELYRLGYAQAERVGLNSDTLKLIDDLMAEAMRTGATPGGVVLVAKDGKVVFQKAYGHHTTGKQRKTQVEDIFDLASITKVAAATPAVMKLEEAGKISIHKALGNALPSTVGTNKQDLALGDIMAHRAGLRSWIPFYQQTTQTTVKGTKPAAQYYSRRSSDKFDIKVTDQLFLRGDFRDSIWQQIYSSEIANGNDYVYSDLGFYMISAMVRHQTGTSLDEYAAENFYQPLGLRTMTYNPREKFNKNRIVPTEEDRYWRNQKVHGYVHDMGAAMLGGVSGHAGLFSNAEDLAVLMQMYLNLGYYGGTQFLRPETVHKFTTRHPDELRRGIGFDMLQLDPDKEPNMSTLASRRTFGHLGFTGTAAWADPDENLVFIFLSNRTYPSYKNNRLGNENYRPKIHSVVYRALTEEK
ncbi:MAG: glycoside hydrolase family 3 N-terminal domain-containing protein [Bacteroidota bacterium]